MHKSTDTAFLQQATLPNLSGVHLPPMALAIDARYQFAVDCGAYAAMIFFEEHPDIALHTHLPASLACFQENLRHRVAGLEVAIHGRDQPVVDAFVAGYLGRIQQELRTMQPAPQSARHDDEPAYH
ncbi:hypothetical protein QN372_00965 [Undibacterium sp. RTI2.1]|uniref:hypothetical protein n=1 Tax=unclassified Undibacterium TaxID=2630295 RepID=UPI002B22AEE3|nr:MULTISPECIES: hypothetical protein [unclassified Undibacterium]MEB0029310.1 hypothetical protein [Undibacterium sp. RTI2.1]MEB0115618.1 hypothetical protein [Undibacterium sp. RTI2.2]